MADIQLDSQVTPSVPASGKGVIYFNSANNRATVIYSNGEIYTLDGLYNTSVAAQGAGFATDTYLTGSSIFLNTLVPRVKTVYKCTFDVSKTAAGVVAPVIILRMGTLGTTGDAARLTFTFPAQTAIADVGTFEITAVFRTIGSGTSAVLQGRATLIHKGTATGLTGLSIEPGPTVQVTSAGFDSTVLNSIIGLSVNGGTSAAWTVQLVEATGSQI